MVRFPSVSHGMPIKVERRTRKRAMVWSRLHPLIVFSFISFSWSERWISCPCFLPQHTRLYLCHDISTYISILMKFRVLLSLSFLWIGSVVQPVRQEIQCVYHQKHSPCHLITSIRVGFCSFTFPSLSRWAIVSGATVPRTAWKACKRWTASRSVCSRPAHSVVRVSTDRACDLCLFAPHTNMECLPLVCRSWVCAADNVAQGVCHVCSSTHLPFILTQICGVFQRRVRTWWFFRNTEWHLVIFTF